MSNYYTMQSAQDILDSQFLSTSDEMELWNALNSTDRQVVLSRATQTLNLQCYLGVQEDRSSCDAFPRTKDGVHFGAPPMALLIGALINELRKQVYIKSEYSAMQTFGVKKYAVEGASVEFSEQPVNSQSFLFDDIKQTYFNNWIY